MEMLLETRVFNPKAKDFGSIVSLIQSQSKNCTSSFNISPPSLEAVVNGDSVVCLSRSHIKTIRNLTWQRLKNTLKESYL